jgi:hypothetical protein
MNRTCNAERALQTSPALRPSQRAGFKNWFKSCFGLVLKGFKSPLCSQCHQGSIERHNQRSAPFLYNSCTLSTTRINHLKRPFSETLRSLSLFAYRLSASASPCPSRANSWSCPKPGCCLLRVPATVRPPKLQTTGRLAESGRSSGRLLSKTFYMFKHRGGGSEYWQCHPRSRQNQENLPLWERPQKQQGSHHTCTKRSVSRKRGRPSI